MNLVPTCDMEMTLKIAIKHFAERIQWWSLYPASEWPMNSVEVPFEHFMKTLKLICHSKGMK